VINDLTKDTDNITKNSLNLDEIYKESFDNSPAYQEIFLKTIGSARSSYTLALIMSVLMFITGISLIVVAIIFAFKNDTYLFPAIFSGAGITSLVALLLYRPIERIQLAVNNLIQSQVACLSFHAQFNVINKTMVLKSNLFNNTDPNYADELIKCSKYILDATSQLIKDLNSIENRNEN
jgi:hypothetical protein